MVRPEPPHKLRDEATAYSISPDGSLIAFGTNKGRVGEREIWLMGPDGEQARKLYDTDEDSSIVWLTWSPDGQRIIYVRHDESSDTLVSRDLKGGALTTLLPPSEVKKVPDLSWLTDGRLIYAMDESEAIRNAFDFWVMRIDIRTGEVIEAGVRAGDSLGIDNGLWWSVYRGAEWSWNGPEQNDTAWVNGLADHKCCNAPMVRRLTW